MAPRSIFINFPGAAYTHACALAGARAALAAPDWDIVDGSGAAGEQASEAAPAPAGHDVYFADYDTLPFETLLGSKAQCSSYVIRKALIRKHHLAHALHAHALKSGSSSSDPSSSSSKPVQSLTPRTWIFELQFPDELDELLADDLYDLRDALEHAEQEGTRKWYILKPGMADRGNGIRLFDSLDKLREILEELEGENDEEGEEDDEEAEGGMLSQLRHFVIQEYLSRPLLLAPPAPAPTPSSLRKFHLRAYVLCIGGLKVFLYDSMLALFAPVAYAAPAQADDTTEPDPRIHLTNTCLHADGTAAADGRPAEENVHLLDDLVGVPMAAAQNEQPGETFTEDMLAHVRREAARTIGAVFEGAARGGSVHWQAWPNAWEIFGVDLLVGWDEDASASVTEAKAADGLRVWLLEVNAQPDFAQSGAKLQTVIERLFARSLELAVIPHAFPARAGALLRSDEPGEEWKQGTSRDGMTLCLASQLSKAW